MRGIPNQLRLERVTCILLIVTPLTCSAHGEVDSNSINLSAAQVVVPDNLSGPEKKAVELLIDEIAARTRMRLPVANAWPADTTVPVIGIGPAAALDKFAGRFAKVFSESAKQSRAEGYRIRTLTERDHAPAILVVGNDSRGVLFGVGKLLRTLSMSRDHIDLNAPLNLASAPAMPIRGHQIGYRPKTNSYYAWDLAQWEQYICDMAVFGCNSIELIPPRSDDDADSPHFPLPPLKMMRGVSQIAADYGLDVWIWYPAMEPGYSTPAAIDAALTEWADVLSKLPRVNALFVPTGDPGDVPPQELMAMLERQAEQLSRLHRGAQIWISMQSFTQPQFDEMMMILKTEPKWLAGVVYGPQTRISLAKLRQILPKRYPIRGYPDITHSMRCEYPVPDWDLAYALTEGREVINPRPLDETIIFQRYRDNTRGVITYSEGCNDDVNKMIWSGLCWDPEINPTDTLREYSRYFIGPQFTDDFAQGLLALERNWRGPLLDNEDVLTTLKQFREMEAAAEPWTLRNWRFQQALYRANYDAYQRLRLIHETEHERAAIKVLATASQIGPSRAIEEADKILRSSDGREEYEALGSRINQLAEALFQSIGMQLSVEKYRAIEVGRGANLDEIDVPLNNRVWLQIRFADLRKLADDVARQRGVDEIVHWEDPGPGGYYDDLGNPNRQPHLVRSVSYEQDPGCLETPTVGFRSDLSWRRSWCTHIDGLYRTPVTMRYEKLDPHAAYKLRVVYAGDNREAKVRLVAIDESTGGRPHEIEIHPFQLKPRPTRPVEFSIPTEATSDGSLTLVWHANPERGGPGRGCQIAEVWLIKISAE